MIRRSLFALSLALAACSGSKVDSLNPALTGLNISAGTLNPAFQPDVHEYGATVPFGTLNLTETPVADAGASVAVTQDGQVVSAGTLTVPVHGSSLIVKIVVSKGSATSTYTV